MLAFSWKIIQDALLEKKRPIGSREALNDPQALPALATPPIGPFSFLFFFPVQHHRLLLSASCDRHVVLLQSGLFVTLRVL